MSSVEETRRVVRTSAHAVVVPVGSGTYAAWNRYFPDVMLMNERGVALQRHCDAKLQQAQARVERIVLGRDGAATSETISFE